MKMLDLLCSENQRINLCSFSGMVTLRTAGGITGILTTPHFWNYLDLLLPEHP